MIQELNGQNVTQSKKLEIKPTADLAGLSELLQLCQTDSVLLQDKLNKLESHLKILTHAADHADLVAKEDILQLLGATLSLPDSLLVETTEIKIGANLILYLIVIIIAKENTDLAHLLDQPHHAKKNVNLVMKKHTAKILENYLTLMEFLQERNPSKLNL